jgi:hypothetical protein
MLALTYGTDPVQDAIALGLLVSTIYSIRATRATKAAAAKVDIAAEVAQTNSDKLDEVHGLVNQQLTDSEGRRDDAEKGKRKAEGKVRILEADAEAKARPPFPL